MNKRKAYRCAKIWMEILRINVPINIKIERKTPKPREVKGLSFLQAIPAGEVERNRKVINITLYRHAGKEEILHELLHWKYPKLGEVTIEEFQWDLENLLEATVE